MTDRSHSNCRVVIRKPSSDSLQTKVPAGFPKNMPLRFIIYHLHPVSARLLLLELDGLHLCLPYALPALSELLENNCSADRVSSHPRQFLALLCQYLCIPESSLEVEKSFRLWVDTPAEPVAIYLTRAVDRNPFSVPDFARWIQLTDSYSLVDVERQMLAGIYQHLLA